MQLKGGFYFRIDMANYYLKLHFDIVHDPKMCRLPDRLYRRVIELFVLAGKEENHGNLPSIAEMAWELRISEADLLDDMRDIHARTKKDDEPNPEITGIVHEEEYGRWMVTNFDKRQASKDPTGAERQERYRERNENKLVTRDVTRDITRRVKDRVKVKDKNKELKQELEQEQELEPEIEPQEATEITAAWQPEKDVVVVFNLWENNVGLITPIIKDTLSDWIDTYPTEWIRDAITEGVQRNGRNVAYIGKILSNWQEKGRDAKPGSNGKGAQPPPGSPEDRARYTSGKFADVIQAPE